MIKKLLIILLLYSAPAQAQPKWQYGLEININAPVFFDTRVRDVLNSCNGFLIYKSHELYAGFDVSRLGFEKVHRIWGFEGGYKYHLPLNDRKSNFVADLNYQFGKYCRRCYAHVNYDFVPTSWEDACFAFQRVRTNLLSLGLGYELFYTQWLSTSLTAGPGINWGVLSDPPFDTVKYFNRSSREPSTFGLFNLLIKASLRITL